MTLYDNCITMPKLMYPHPHVSLEDRIEALVDSHSLFRPTGARNQRKARCADCGRWVPAGEGRQWDLERNFGVSGKSYFCAQHHDERLAMLEIQPDIAEQMALIEAWCLEWLPGSYAKMASREVDRIIGNCGLRAVDVAEAIADRLPVVDDPGYASVTALARRVAAQIGGE